MSDETKAQLVLSRNELHRMYCQARNDATHWRERYEEERALRRSTRLGRLWRRLTGFATEAKGE